MEDNQYYASTPEEANAMLTRKQMEIDSVRHKMIGFVESLDKDQLTTYQQIMEMFGQAGSAQGAYFDGLASAELQRRFNICPACGQNHDEILRQGIDLDTERLKDAWWNQPGVPEQLETYGVFPDDKADPANLRVRCKNCDMVSVSLDDRMLRRPGPDGCQGCLHKGAWG